MAGQPLSYRLAWAACGSTVRVECWLAALPVSPARAAALSDARWQALPGPWLGSPVPLSQAQRRLRVQACASQMEELRARPGSGCSPAPRLAGLTLPN